MASPVKSPGMLNFSGLILLFLVSAFPLAHAADPLADVNLNEILPPGAAAEIVKTFGILNNHRPFQGAVSIGNSIDLGIEVSLVHLPSTFASTLTDAGLLDDPSKLSIGALPTAKVHFHKGLGKSAEFGASALYFRGNKIWGLDLKFVLFEPEEGMTWAFRMAYGETDLDLSRFGLKGIPINSGGVEVGSGGLILNTRTITPQLLGSVRLDFSEPYIGAGYEYASGQISVPVTIAVQGYSQTLSTAQTSAGQGIFFTGVSFRVPNAGFRWVLEGGYGTAGMSYLGTLIGLSL